VIKSENRSELREGPIVSSRLPNVQWTVPAVLSAALVTACGSHDALAAAASQELVGPYLTPQKLVHVGEGRTINLVCLGHGSPTVILSAGLGGWSLHWRLVQPPLAQRTRVCAWDRAGFGFSSASPEPQDIVQTTGDLERALKSAGIQGPYVMVGHSLGGYEVLRFTDLHRKSVVGMVLVDPAIPDQMAVMERIAPLFRAKGHALDEGVVKELQDCAAKLRDGTLKRSTPQFEQCTVDPNVPAVFPGLKAAIARLNADPARLLTEASAVEELDNDTEHDSREVMNTQRRYGNMPLIVLTAGRDESTADSLVPGTASPAEVAEFHRQVAQYFRDAWGPAHDAYATLSTRGRNQLVPDSGHGIPNQKPQVVIAAVAEVLDEVRPSAPREP
jgi:pimeloyl-ACP methyl ester carboxylesterase